tara:strand:+ start:32121 stop:33281 length:1161 start_codon:yes stop_codon:yes gene_type:complete
MSGARTWSSGRDEEGHRTYMISHLVEATSSLDGPATVMQTAGLPTIGSTWNFDNDTDVWAFCTPFMKVKIHKEKQGDKAYHYQVDQKFTTASAKFSSQRCQDTTIENPLLEPQKIAGSFLRYTEEATKDKDGDPITNSSHEMFRGPSVEFDEARPTVKIGQNVLSLGLSTFADMINKVNSVAMWGLSARSVKLSSVSWTRNLYGACYFYYTRDFEFDINYDTFDRDILDEGTKALNGYISPRKGNWVLQDIDGNAPDPNNPRHFNRIKDVNGENVRMPLNGAGIPINPQTANPDNAAAVNKGGGLVEIPLTGHSFNEGDVITITGSVNYNGTYTIVSVTENGIVINATYVAETFTGSEVITSTLTYITVQKYKEANFFDLGIPITL